jgi:hypothetical protein
MKKEQIEHANNTEEMKYIMSLYPVSLVFRDTGKHVAWSEGEGWCFYIDGEDKYMICDSFHHAMQKLLEPL